MRRVTLRCAARLVIAALWLLVEVCQAESGAQSLAERVIWAVNAGGDTHTDVHGIQFKKDPLEGKLGKASDYGVRLPILRSSPEDQILYQTERYNEDTFGYEVPIREEGDYILVMKYAEVYFAQSQQKVWVCGTSAVHGSEMMRDFNAIVQSKKKILSFAHPLVVTQKFEFLLLNTKEDILKNVG